VARPLDQHLTPDELAALAPESSNWHGSSSPSVLEEASAHLEACQHCRTLLERYVSAATALSSVGQSQTELRKPACPPEEIWYSVVTRLLPAERSESFVTHAADCDYCGPRLRDATTDLESELTPEEGTIVSQLESNQKHWKDRLADRLASTSSSSVETKRSPAELRSPKLNWLWPRLALSLVALFLLVLVVRFAWKVNSHPEVEGMLAKAYTQNRTLELRIPGASYAQLQESRGAEKSHVGLSPELLEAESIIARALVKSPNDPRWLAARGRAELLEGNFDAAINSLQRAREGQPESAPLLTDLASAYFQRADATQHSIDYSTSIQLLSHALSLEPDAAIPLFNRAIALERMTDYIGASQDWEHFLRVNHDTGWQGEAERHLSDVRQKLNTRDQSLLRPLLSPEAIANDSVLAHDSSINERIEEYADQASMEWLSIAYPTSRARSLPSQSGSRRAALQTLAKILKRDHDDDWLSDILKSSKSAEFPAAVATMGQAMKANQAGDPITAGQFAAESEKQFHKLGNSAGILRSEIEQLDAFQFSMQASRCLALANTLKAKLEERPYSWMKTHTALERSICLNLTEQFDEAMREGRAAVEKSRDYSYPVLQLRALGMLASFYGDRGDFSESWRLNREGLLIYWSGSYPPARSYQFYWNLSSLAHDLDNLQVSLISGQEAVESISKTTYSSAEAMARYRIGAMAHALRQDKESETQLRRADELFAALPDSGSKEIFQLDTKIALAEIAAEQGRLANSLITLGALEPQVARMSDFSVPLRFYATLGKLQLMGKQTKAAQKSLETALRLCDLGGTTMSNDRDRLNWKLEISPVYRSAVDLAARTGEPALALELWERFKGWELNPSRKYSQASLIGSSVSQVAFTEPQSNIESLTEVRDILPTLRSVTVLSYAELDGRILGWAFDDGGIQDFVLDVDPPTLRAASERFRRLCSDPSSDLAAVNASGRQLYDWLIQPVRHRLRGGRSLVVESDDFVANLPIQALIDPVGQYLYELFPITISAGILYDSGLRSTRPFSKTDRALVVGAPTVSNESSSDFLPIHDAVAEAQDVAARFDRVSLLVGDHASFSEIKRHGSENELFHFAGHAISTSVQTGLVLSRSSPGDTSSQQPLLLDVPHLRESGLTRCRLVVLSACATARGIDGTLADPTNLVRAFLRAGVPQIIASRWDVDSTATSELMRAFYKSLLLGTPASVALTDAENVIRRHPSTSHPYYWSAFALFGRP
jgi:CHAT domain-containing protein/tetratricopeptide (TPR) repeat protein